MSLAARQETDTSRVLICMPKRFEFKIHKEFRQTYERGPAIHEYVLDLKATEYCDSSALGMLLQLHEHAGHRPERVRLLNVSENLKMLLEVAKLSELFNVE